MRGNYNYSAGAEPATIAAAPAQSVPPPAQLVARAAPSS
jgi:hypothetical protein